MAAAAKDGHIIFAGSPTGEVILQSESFSNTDVANALATWYSNGSLTFVNDLYRNSSSPILFCDQIVQNLLF